MTKKDFELIAAALRDDAAHLAAPGFDYTVASAWERGAYDQWNTTAQAIGQALATTNPLFSLTKFLNAAGVACLESRSDGGVAS